MTICWVVTDCIISISFIWPEAGLSTAGFVYVHNFTQDGTLGRPDRSCYKRCNGPYIGLGECMCDIHCMFIGDCCYDYLMECDKREYNLNNALTAQSSFYQHFKQYSSCKHKYLNDYDATKGGFLQIVSCPVGNELEKLCEGHNGSRTFSSYIPVTARGILFTNVYCAACHGIRIQEVELVTETYDIKCELYADMAAQLVPFQHNLRCGNPVLVLSNKYQGLHRFRGTCVCPTPMYSDCTNTEFKDECHAYTAVLHQNGPLKVWFPGDIM